MLSEKHDKESAQPYIGLNAGEPGDSGMSTGRRLTVAAGVVAVAVTVLVLVIASANTEPSPAARPLLACYYTTGGSLAPEELSAAAGLCSHIIVAFASVQACRVALASTQAAEIAAVVALKREQPRLRVLLSVGGSGGGDGFADMVRDHASRKKFIGSLRDTLRNLSLDGVDLDWEFPGVGLAAGRQRQHFSQLVRELRVEFTRERRPYLLTVAAAAPDPIADAAYDVDQLDLYTDWVNLMTYDFHYYSEFTPFTGHNAPLFARADERLYLATLNANHTARAYLRRGLRPERAALGVPAFGHSFALVSAAAADVGSPARGVGALGGGGGFVAQDELCAFLRDHEDAALRRDLRARVPYMARGTEWVSYEDETSVRAKAALVSRLRLAGAMLYSLNADDPSGSCGRGSFPLTRALYAALPARPTDPTHLPAVCDPHGGASSAPAHG